MNIENVGYSANVPNIGKLRHELAKTVNHLQIQAGLSGGTVATAAEVKAILEDLITNYINPLVPA